MSLLLRQTTQNQGGQRRLTPHPPGVDRGSGQVPQPWNHLRSRVPCCHSGTGRVPGQHVQEAAVQTPPVGRTAGHSQRGPLPRVCHAVRCRSAWPLVPEPPNEHSAAPPLSCLLREELPFSSVPSHPDSVPWILSRLSLIVFKKQ